MKILLAIILLLPLIVCAQDSVVTISPAMFNNHQTFISSVNGWVFKQGSDTAWAQKDISINNWKKLKPTELSKSYADKNGKVECWFRIKIKIDSTFKNETFGLKGSTWAATDFYIDGKLVASQGSTGANGKPYHDYYPYDKLSVPVDLKAGKEYTIAIHFVDFISSFPPYYLKSELDGLHTLIRITGSGYDNVILLNAKQVIFYCTLWISVCTIASLLLWLIYFLNPYEKNLLIIALCSTFIAAAEFCQYNTGTNTHLSFTGYIIYNFLFQALAALVCVFIPLMFARVFKRHTSRALKYFLFIFFISFIATFFMPNNIGNTISTGLLAIILVVGIYYIAVSWKNLKGAQWAIVTGILVSIAWAIAFLLASIFPVQNHTALYLFITGYSLSFPLSLLVYVAIRFKEIINDVKTNAQQVILLSEEKKQQALNQQKILEEEVAKQTAVLRTTLSELKSTQSQLIQSEKMASLGELTAGIAHEIQNPLNFVNNFSEVSNELVDEMKEELVTGNVQLATEIADDIKQNLEKINHHGKRADAIVKGMLQHSRQSSGKKEPTDINALCDENLRLSYHGLRAKDKTFNADFKTDFDESIGKINIVPQDVGRVLLNLFNNAFYATSEKFKAESLKQNTEYKPLISIQTKKLNDKIEIRVEDNGNGIPQNVVDKIFQPFFTTKPTGEGTGLGLSLSYDIIKAHGGEIKVETKGREGTTFIIILQVT